MKSFILKLIPVWAVILPVISALSCGEPKILKANSGGKEAELLIVADPEVWKTSLGDSILAYFNQEFPSIPQSEPSFDVVKLVPKDFESVFKLFKNILLINIDPNQQGKDPKVAISEDIYAKDQLVVSLTASTGNEFMSAFRNKRDEISRIFHERDILRLQRKNEVTRSALITDELKEKFGISLTLPEGFAPAAADTHFYMATFEALKKVDKDEHQITKGIWVYSFPYTDPNTFTMSYLTAIRDSVTRKYLLGANDTQYVQIESMLPLDSSAVNLENEFAMEIRGLWTMKNGFMGGPFITYAVVDKRNKRVLMLDGFVFAPRFDKRNYMLEIEAILRSMKFAGNSGS